MNYLHKIDEASDKDKLLWNVPEQKQGFVNILGGNSQNFRMPIKIAEYMTANYQIKTLNIVLPDALKTKLPPLPNFVFLSSTDSGSLANKKEILDTLNLADYNLVPGDLSKNSITIKAVTEALQEATKPSVVTRDAVDLLAEEQTERALMNENLVIVGSMAQLQKIFRAVYYPKVLLLTQPLTQVAEALHKFTLSYPVSIITLHDGQILIVKNGEVNVIPLNKTSYSPISFWSGELTAKIVALNLYNPNEFLQAATLAVF